MEPDELQKLAKLLYAPWPNVDLTPERLEILGLVLRETSFEESRAALLVLLSKPRTFPPAPGDLLELVNAKRRAMPSEREELPEMPSERKPLNLWGQVEAKINH